MTRNEILLALETSTNWSSMAVLENGELLAETGWEIKRDHSGPLQSKIRDLIDSTGLDVEDISSVAVSGGPGSFTGLRVGAGFAKGFIFNTSRKLYAVCSLETTAAGLSCRAVSICVMFDARKSEVYSGTYRWKDGTLEVLRQPVSARPEAVIEGLEGETVFIGSGSSLYRDEIVSGLGEKALFVPALFDKPRASLMGHLVFASPERYSIEEPGTFEPSYIRLPEAVVKWKEIKRK